jgi:hypothetical protein
MDMSTEKDTNRWIIVFTGSHKGNRPESEIPEGAYREEEKPLNQN